MSISQMESSKIGIPYSPLSIPEEARRELVIRLKKIEKELDRCIGAYGNAIGIHNYGESQVSSSKVS